LKMYLKMKLHPMLKLIRVWRTNTDGIDMEAWREMICSKSYGTHSQKLTNEISTLARRLAMDTIPHDHILTLLICRLIPLKKKDNGIRPVGVDECLQQIIDKTITGLLKEDIIHAVGTLQT